LRPDKEKVVDEVWDDARVESYLHKEPMAGETPAFSVLLNAYRAMRPADFRRFMEMYAAAGRDPAAPSASGETLRSTITPHRHAGPFLEILDEFGG
jgi:hypothetical protein